MLAMYGASKSAAWALTHGLRREPLSFSSASELNGTGDDQAIYGETDRDHD